ncbi:hypothetical protein IWQ60_003466 [Tieghemiomyces parasiticus]|uniref:RWD domain-containing protein n=1 Tax=Tieghemiomyces parasiticus TaxID=78921 RepID=A0A9W8AA69_9FUNG|nr:hypothetical protein IWQ60_003466 [Tieghemiomyces parasiticus]
MTDTNVPAAETADNRERQDEEVTALEAIYGDAILRPETDSDPPGTHRTYTGRFVIDDRQVVLTFRLYYPASYPSRDPPLIEWLGAAHVIPSSTEVPEDHRNHTFIRSLANVPLTASLLEPIAENFARLWEDSLHEVVIFQWLDWLEGYLRERWADLPSLDKLVERYAPSASGTPAHIVVEEDATETCLSPPGATPPDSTNNTTLKMPADAATAPKPSFDRTKLLVQPLLHQAYLSDFVGLTLPPITTGGRIEDRHSVFVAHVANVTSIHLAQFVVWQLLQDRKIAKATHNIVAYRIGGAPTTTTVATANAIGRQGGHQDYDDDGESAAGGRLLHLLQLLDIHDVVVMVTRWYGGIHLGADRFKHINNSARQALDAAGLIPAKPAGGAKGRR